MLQILPVTFPFFALVLLGYVAARRRMLPLEAVAGLNTFVLYFALPCMLYRFTATTPLVRLLDAGVSLVWLLCALAMVALAVAATRASWAGWNEAAFGALVAAFPNSGFMGVPLLVGLFGPPAAAPVIVVLTIDLVVTSSLCVALSRLDAAGEHGARRALLQALRGIVVNPLPWAILVGGTVGASGLQLPGPVLQTIEMLATAASPVALFTIGAVLARSQSLAAAKPAGRNTDVPLIAFGKLIVHPLLIFGVGKAAIAAGLALDSFTLTVLVLTAALPSASNVPMLAERYGADAGRIARIVLLSTAAAFVSLSAAVALLVG